MTSANPPTNPHHAAAAIRVFPYPLVRVSRSSPTRSAVTGVNNIKRGSRDRDTKIDALADEEWTRNETVDRMRAFYQYRKRRLAARAGAIKDEGYEDSPSPTNRWCTWCFALSAKPSFACAAQARSPTRP